MKPNTHYGVIPGCNQPSLYTAGSEVLLTTFRIAVDPEVIDLSNGDEIRFRVRARGIHQMTGVTIGVGVGECSTSEEKYKWRNAVCDEEYDNTPETHRRIKYSKYKDRITKKKQIRTNPADLANTVLKMAKKRAQIDLTLTATAASDIFTQDIEDLPDELRPEADGGEQRQSTVRQPQSKSQQQPSANADDTATEGQVRMIKAKLAAGNLTEGNLFAQFSVEAVEQIKKGQVNEVLNWIAEASAEAANV